MMTIVIWNDSSLIDESVEFPLVSKDSIAAISNDYSFNHLSMTKTESSSQLEFDEVFLNYYGKWKIPLEILRNE